MNDTNEFSKEMVYASANAVESVLKIADKYQIDRHWSLQRFAEILRLTSALTTYKDYKFDESGGSQ